MSEDGLRIFFYGLFMDAELLARSGVRPGHAEVGSVSGFKLRIGARATLVESPGDHAHGVVMTLSHEDVRKLYAEPSVADYVAEEVEVMRPDGSVVLAYCYNLPESELTGTNPEYAAALHELASSLGLPEAYLETIRAEGL